MPLLLVHFDLARILQINLDVLKEQGFNAILFYIKNNGNKNTKIRHNIKNNKDLNITNKKKKVN